MVTTLKPKPETNRTAAGYSQDGASKVGKSEYSEADLAKFLHEVYGISITASPKSKTSFLMGIASPLRALYHWLAGPPMTQRDRERQAFTEARTRGTASLGWFQHTTL